MTIRCLMLAALAATAAPMAIAAAPAGPARHLEPIDLFALETAADPQISPDGSRIAYVRRSNDIMADRARTTIWLVDAKTGAQTPLVATGSANSQPRWSPDGRRLAYVAAAEGGPAQLYVRWMDGGETARITTLPTAPSAIAWSPDGRQIAYLLPVAGEAPKLGQAPPKPEGAKWADPLQVISAVTYRRDGQGYLKAAFDHLFVVPADGGAPRQLTFGEHNDTGPLSWSPDGRTILISSNRRPDWEREPQDSEVFAVDVAAATMRALTDRRGPDRSPVFSPDGRQIAFTGYDDRNLGYQNGGLYVMPATGGAPRLLTGSLDRSVSNPVWAADGRSVAVQYEDRAAVKVARIGLDGAVRPVTDALVQSDLDRPYAGGSFTMARDGTVAFTGGTALRPADVSIVRAGQPPRRLTTLNEALLAPKVLGPVRKLAVTAADGRAIDAWLVTPPDAPAGRRHPLILEIHGGPYSAYGPSFSTDDQLYAAAGYAVLYVNPRGSTSYGEQFANLIQNAYPGDDYGDLMAAVDAAIADGAADPDNLFVTGGSGGGVLTAWIVGKTDRFKAAATQKPVIDWASFVLTADNTAFFARYWFGKMPWEDPQGYWARSPLSLVGNVKTPTMVVVGAEDYRTPVSEAEQYYAALQLRGVPTTLVKVPGASHGGIAARPSQSAAKASAILAWFDRYRQQPKN
ncbi:MAG: S9 family peptidase [Sphingomonas fennica]